MSSFLLLLEVDVSFYLPHHDDCKPALSSPKLLLVEELITTI